MTDTGTYSYVEETGEVRVIIDDGQAGDLTVHALTPEGTLRWSVALHDAPLAVLVAAVQAGESP